MIEHYTSKVVSAVDLIVEERGIRSVPVTGKKELTFVKDDYLVQFGIDLVGYRNWSDPNGMDCNIYTGNTACSELRSVLCAKIDDTPQLAYFIYEHGVAMPA